MKDQLELKEGEYYFTDRGFGNGGIVKLVKLGKYFCMVTDPYVEGYWGSWKTMIHRLSKLTEQEKATL